MKDLELKERMSQADVDICCIQESKLSSRNKTPKIDGYATIRHDRLATSGGGLLTFIKTDLRFKELQATERLGMESSAIRVFSSRREYIDINNIYLPNTSTQETFFDPAIVNANPSSLILGDLNGHSPMWDENIARDARGEVIENFIVDSNLVVLNDGSTTRVSRVEGGSSSTPDLSLAGERWSNKCSWTTLEAIGASDHLPIEIILDSKIDIAPTPPRPAKWKRTGVNWEPFTEAVKESVGEFTDEPILTRRINRFATALKKAAEQHVGKTKPGKKTKTWLTPTVRGKIRKRNRLRRTIARNRAEWLEACQEANEAVREAKAESWKDLLEGAGVGGDGDSDKMWSIVKGLNGTPDTNSPNEAMKHNGKDITDPKKKANIFAGHYASVSKLSMTKQDRDFNRSFKRKIESPHVDTKDQSAACKQITMVELCSAIKRQKGKGACGADDIPPSFLKNLPDNALEELLAIFNLSLSNADIPSTWRNAIIIPLLKAGKTAAELASYRPVSLTSCVVKLLERILADRLYHMAETKGWFSQFQAGFRRGRSCEDQILRVIQKIEDGFQQSKCQRSVMVLLDFSKAYDTVWREKLLDCMIDKGVPVTIVRWLRAFLSDRHARVRLHNVLSKSRIMQQGLPQGSVLAPLLFLFYINNLADLLPKDNLNCMFADDVSILATDRSSPAAQAKVQSAIDIVVRWSKEWKLSLNAAKSEGCFFSSWSNDAKWSPTLEVDGIPIPHVQTPRLLGVLLDRQLTFKAHIDKIEKESSKQLNLMRAVSHAEWGWDRSSLRTLFFALVRSKLNYAAAAWQPWVSDTGMERLDRIQNKGLRIVTGMYQSSPLQALRLEADVPSYATASKRMILQSYEKALRSAPDHPKRLALEEAMPPRNKRPSWYLQANELARLLPAGADHRKPLALFSTPPWYEYGQYRVHASVPGIASRADDGAAKLAACIERITNIDATLTIYTDGSATGGTRNGGAAAVVTRGDPAYPEVLHTIKQRGRTQTSSYEEEVLAMEMALRWTIESANDPSFTILICTDSQSLCNAIEAHDDNIHVVHTLIPQISANLTIQWVPGHSDLPGNELADQAAKEAAGAVEEGTSPISYSCACTAIKIAITDPEPTHARTKEIYAKRSKKLDKRITNRSDQVLLARLRSGHLDSLNAYKQRIAPDSDPKCDLCKDADQSLEHWLIDCAANTCWRQATFGCPSGSLQWLATHPEEVIALAKKQLLLRRDPPTS